MLVPKIRCDELSDREIIRKAIVETDYFSCLYDRYEERLLRYIRHLTHVGPQDADDILQEAFIHIWQHLLAYNDQLPLTNWIYRIVHNEAITFLRQKKAYGKDRTLELDESRMADLLPEDDTLSTGANEDHWVLTRQLLAQLPIPYREVLVLKYLENMHYDQISDILKIPEGTVAVRINRAKKAFQKLSANTSISHLSQL